MFGAKPSLPALFVDFCYYENSRFLRIGFVVSASLFEIKVNTIHYINRTDLSEI